MEGVEADKLGLEKEKLEEKIRNLSKIIEVMASQKKEAPEEGEGLKTNFEGLKKTISSLEGKIKKFDSKPKPADDLKPVLSALQEKIALLDAIPAIADALKRLEDGRKDIQTLENPFGGFGTLPSKENSIFFSELKNSFGEFKSSAEMKMEELEKKLNILSAKLDTKTLKNLEDLAASKDEILNVHVPRLVREDVDKILSAVSFSLSSVTEQMNVLTIETEKLNNRISVSMDFLDKLSKRMEEKIK